MATKLTEITTQYHTFVDNQVLTKDQLNEFINYFGDQDRLSRIFLSGVGIVCGFNLMFDPSKSIVTLTQGVGVTTDGDLINLQENASDSNLKSIDLKSIEYKRVRKFEDNFANYPFFKKFKTVDGNLTEVPIDMWELLPGKADNANDLGTIVNLKEKVVLIYLESYSRDGDLCTAVDCDNQGIEQVAKLHVLLVSKADAEFILSLDSVFSKHSAINTVLTLPEVAVRRVVLNELNSSNYSELKRAYYQALQEDNLIKNLTDGMKQIFESFNSLLELNVSDSELNDYFFKFKNIFRFDGYTVPFDIQYRYDLIKDLVDTYNEVKELLFLLKEECCPDIKAFPKHLMLGSLEEIQSEVKNYRHSYYKSPAHDHGDSRIQQCKSLMLKWLQLISHFHATTGETKITPSNKLPDLSFRTIPFYYEIKQDFLAKWNYFKTKKNRYDTNLCYHTSLLSNTPQIQDPLNFSIDSYDFYRIEGHQGKDYRKVLEEINNLKTKYGLSFDVKALSVNVNSENLNIADYECEFEDLSVLLKAWTAEQECILAQVSEFFSGFSTIKPGTNLSEKFAFKPVEGIDFSLSKKESTPSKKTSEKTSTKAQFTATGNYTYHPISYSINNVVLDNLNTNKDALGSVMKMALDETKGGSVNDIIAKANNLMSSKLNPEIWKNKPEIKTFVIDQSIDMMAYSHVLIQKMPGFLVNVNLSALNNYKLTLNELCARVEKMKSSYQSIDLGAPLKSSMGVLITQLSTICCSGKKLQVLLEEINKRKEKILLGLQLSQFIKDHPGLEHKAGVEPGGTFVLIYYSNEITQPTVSKTQTTVGTAKENIHVQSELSSYGAARVPATVVKEYPIYKIPSTELPAWFRLSPNIPNNTVVADFALPYTCFSDCQSVNFILPKTGVSLRLEKDHFCLGQDSGPLLFDVSPSDGIIKADQDVTGMTISGKKLTIDQKTFPNKMLGKTIHFTVNKQITDCSLTVYKGVQFDFNVPKSPTSQTEITFLPTGNLEGASFLWRFGDDNISQARNPSHKYILPVNDQNKVTVSLTVTAANGVCQNTVEHEIEFKLIEAKQISLKKTIFCENDGSSYPFIISPAGAQANITGPGVPKNPEGAFVFVPKAAGVGNFEFKLNGKSSGLKVSVEAAPVAKFTPAQIVNSLLLTNNSTGAVSYVWWVNGKEIKKADKKPFTIPISANSPKTWTLKLTAISKNCGSDTTPTMRFPVKPNQNPGCHNVTRAAISADLKKLKTLDIPNSEPAHATWLETSSMYGGTRKFNKGVLNNVEDYLSGKNNNKLQTMFEKPLTSAAKQLSALNQAENKKTFKNVLEMYRLQQQLYYNILRCQNQETIKASSTETNRVLNLIQNQLKLLKEKQIKMPATFQNFMKDYEIQVKKIPVLKNHIKTIMTKKLI